MIQADTLKTGWKLVKFGDVVRLSKDRAANPEADGIERYVGLEHIDPDDLRIRRWGLVAEGTTFTSKFKPGHVLFGKRRAYQRKVAVADFEGVCSGDIYVFESANPKVLLPELLPLICQMDRFFEYAIGTSAGSLSPRTNWTSLAKFEFALPPPEEQKRIVRLLWEIETLVYLYDTTLLAGQNLLRATLLDFLSDNGSISSDFYGYNTSQKLPVMPLDNVLQGIIDYRGKTPSKSSSGIPLITAKNVRDGFISLEPAEFIPAESYSTWMTRGIPKSGDILFTMEAPLGYVAPVPDYKFALAQRIIALRPETSKITSRFLYWLMRSPIVQKEIFKRATGTTAQGIKQSTLCQIPVPLPPIDLQDKITEILDKMLSNITLTNNRLEKIRIFRMYARNKCLGCE